VGWGGWRIKKFIDQIRQYREKAKADAKQASLPILGCESPRARELAWFVIDDQVMGGRSSSALEVSDGKIDFSGNINTKGGGFCSCRTLGDESPLGLPAETRAIEVTATTDSRQYKLTLMTGDSWSMQLPTWAHDFRGEAGVRQTWRLPLESFVPTKQGRPVKGVVLDPTLVTGMGFSLSLYDMEGRSNSHFGDGPFKLSVEGIRILCE
jgi:hypothetical protein